MEISQRMRRVFEVAKKVTRKRRERDEAARRKGSGQSNAPSGSAKRNDR
jgi:hypothetical protein